MTAAFDPYRALGVRRDATDAEVKAAHRRLAKRFHPDAGGDHERFLRVQEAYKVLSDPLLRRDWDAKHAPGPVRADAAGTSRRPRTSSKRAPRPPAPPSEGRTFDGPSDAPSEDPLRRPRSRRAYTWSASDVPWWEEGVSENRRQPGRRRPARPAPRPSRDPNPAESPPPTTEPPNPFDVYNRSSGAAWSMAARAYFRRGDQDLPRRGQFHYEGTQVVTGARARTAAETEARRRARARDRERHMASHAPESAAKRAAATGAAAASAAAPSATAPSAPPAQRPFRFPAAGVLRDARSIHEVREAWRRRSNAATWPTLGERLIYALVAWAPIALAIGFAGATVTGCADARPGCPPYLETAQAVAIALVLGLLVALPKVAYVLALATVGALFVALAAVAALALLGVDVPLSLELSAILGFTLVAGYVASAALVILRSAASRPWYVEPRP